MIYKKIIEGVFIERPNRFIAIVDINGKIESVHVKNTGRCRELLVKGCTVFLSESDNFLRKTKYDLVAVIKERKNKAPLMINMDSQVVNDVIEEWLPESKLFSKTAKIKREITYGKSRFDFCIDDNGEKTYMEVKGVTLENNNIALFPDAPTERGLKHVNELIACVNNGHKACIVFVIQMDKINTFMPYKNMQPAFSDALRKAFISGVEIICLNCKIKENVIVINKRINFII